ncbi:MAG: hypothetical protein JNM28_00880 [Armatimonadetes bacterium]|nr:hypothetical protein [Armatimonadota bacterium]MBS1711136.1 hypothetical protein [Armatimonadota bacterium]
MIHAKSKEIVIGGSLLVLAGIGIWAATHQPKTDLRAERRLVKTTMDAAASEIDLNPKDITVEELMAMHLPADLGGRRGSFERYTFRVHGRLESIELKKDGDFYMVIRGEKGGHTVVEVPDPSICKGSPLEGQIAATRKELEEKYHPTPEKKTVDETVTVTGVGFYGWGKSGKSGSNGSTGARLMPGTGVKFGN